MTPRPPEPDPTHESEAAPVAHQSLTANPSDAEWDDDRMCAARLRAIRLNPDGTRVPEDAPAQSKPPNTQ